MPKAKNSDIYDDQVTDESESSSVGEETYVVEKILKRRKIGSTGKYEYFLKWQGYDSCDNTWEEEGNLNCPDLLEEFIEKHERRKKHKQKKLMKNVSLESFIVPDDASNSSDESKKKRKHKHREEKRSPKKEQEHQKTLLKSKSQREDNLKKTTTQPRQKHKKKKLGAILSYDHVDMDNDYDEVDEDIKPSVSGVSSASKIKKEQPSLKDDKPKTVNVAANKSQSKSQESPIKAKSKKGDQLKEKRSEHNDIDMADMTQNVIESQQTGNLTALQQSKEPQSDEEEESDKGFVLDMKQIPYKILPFNCENGFDRGWEVEKILALTKGETGSDTEAYGIVKFKNFKYSQQIPIEEVKEYASAKLLEFLHDKINRILIEKKQT